MQKLFEILVPTIYGDTNKPIRTRHHKNWDKRVQALSGGLTILKPGKGIWIHEGKEYLERIIPVRIMCTDKIMKIIGNITLQHYRQKAVMYYTVSTECHMIYADPPKHKCAHGYTSPAACPNCVLDGKTVEFEPEDEWEASDPLQVALSKKRKSPERS